MSNLALLPGLFLHKLITVNVLCCHTWNISITITSISWKIYYTIPYIIFIYNGRHFHTLNELHKFQQCLTLSDTTVFILNLDL